MHELGVGIGTLIFQMWTRFLNLVQMHQHESSMCNGLYHCHTTPWIWKRIIHLIAQCVQQTTSALIILFCSLLFSSTSQIFWPSSQIVLLEPVSTMGIHSVPSWVDPPSSTTLAVALRSLMWKRGQPLLAYPTSPCWGMLTLHLDWLQNWGWGWCSQISAFCWHTED